MSECTKEYSRKRCLGEEIEEYVVAARKREIVREREREKERMTVGETIERKICSSNVY